MSSEIEFTVATSWDDAQIVRWAQISTSQRAISSVFGSRQEQLIGHGRAPADVPQVEDSEIIRHARVAQANGIQFLYLLNGRCEHLDLGDHNIKRAFFSELEWIAEELRADCVIVADLRVARLVRSRYSSDSLAIRVSTIAGVTKPKDLEPWLPLGIDGVVLHHDVGRDFELLKYFVGILRKNAPETEIELLVNETCLHGCYTRNAHYARLARARIGYIEGFQQNCNIPKYLDPSLILSARWIRPEDIRYYHQLGVRRFKIAGREMSSSWLERAVHAYMAGKYLGNLIDLCTMTPPGLDVAASDFVFLNNSALDEFLEQLRAWQGGEQEFYRAWSRTLWNQEAFRINDPGSSYDMSKSFPHCLESGKYLRALIDLQGNSDPAFHRLRAGHPVLVQLESFKSKRPSH